MIGFTMIKPFDLKRKDLPLKGYLTIFETKIDEPQMDKDIIKEINKQGDKQNRQTNVKCQMTQWDMHEKPGFKLLSEYKYVFFIKFRNISSFIENLKF